MVKKLIVNVTIIIFQIKFLRYRTFLIESDLIRHPKTGS